MAADKTPKASLWELSGEARALVDTLDSIETDDATKQEAIDTYLGETAEGEAIREKLSQYVLAVRQQEALASLAATYAKDASDNKRRAEGAVDSMKRRLTFWLERMGVKTVPSSLGHKITYLAPSTDVKVAGTPIALPDWTVDDDLRVVGKWSTVTVPLPEIPVAEGEAVRTAEVALGVAEPQLDIETIKEAIRRGLIKQIMVPMADGAEAPIFSWSPVPNPDAIRMALEHDVAVPGCSLQPSRRASVRF